MIGALMGDMIGSPYEWENTDRRDIPIPGTGEHITDDSVMTMAVTKALLGSCHESLKSDPQGFQHRLIKEMVALYHRYPDAGYGGMFVQYLLSEEKRPYHSYGNGSAMRISPVGWMAKDEEEVRGVSALCTEITHDHPEGMKGAEAVALAIFLSRKRESRQEIQRRMASYYPELKNPEEYLRQVRGIYGDCSCPHTVPLALASFLLSVDEKDAFCLAISLGGDSDTIACMAGSVAEAFYHPLSFSPLEKEYLERIPVDFKKDICLFHEKYGTGKKL